MSSDLGASLRRGDRAVLARAISVAENGGAKAQALLERIGPTNVSHPVVGITGTSGAGKSTLIDQLVAELRARDRTVAVVAIDPSSPFSGGAVLGDRCRMNRHQADKGVYIRSLSARGGTGGVSAGVDRVIQVLQASPFDLILVETVGAGQSEIDIRGIADTCIVVCTPNSGDDIQAIKSGILEIADILVANKSDLADSKKNVGQLIMAQSLPSNARPIPVLSTIATTGEGVDTLADRLLELCRSERATAAGDLWASDRRRLAGAVARKLERHLIDAHDDDFEQIAASVHRGECVIDEAAARWVRKVTDSG